MSKVKEQCAMCLNEYSDELFRMIDIEVKGETFQVQEHYYKCLKCREEFTNPHDPIDPLDQAYREYRKRHGLLQPEEIRNFRNSYKLTQKELASLLGLGDVTISRYENGALQETVYDNLLRLAMDPQNLLKLIQKSPASISDKDKRDRIITQLNSVIQSTCKQSFNIPTPPTVGRKMNKSKKRKAKSRRIKGNRS